MIEVYKDGYASRHIACSQPCADRVRNPDFSCFSDGCEFECCGCGACCDLKLCSETGKGHPWHP